MVERVRSGRASLAVEASGSGAPAVVLLHAGVADLRVWAPVQARLAARCRVVAYDRRGLGATTYEAETFSHVDDLVAVLDALGIERAALVGNSQGGRISVDLALAQPERVAGLFLIAPALSGAPEPEITPDLQALSDAIDAADEAGDLDALNELEAQLWLDGPSTPGRVQGAARALFLAMNGRALAAADTGEEVAPPSALERLGEIAVPTALLAGELDAGFLLERVRHMAAEIPGATLELVPGVAHLPMLEDPDLVADRVERFLDRLPS